MFDFAWSELLVIGAIALVVIGPKDLPKAMRTAGLVVRRARSLAREFQNSVDEVIREAELDEIRKTVRDSTKFDLDQQIENVIDPHGEMKTALTPPPEHSPPPTEHSPQADPPATEHGEALHPPPDKPLEPPAP